MQIESQADIDGLLNVGRIVANCLVAMMDAARDGMTTGELDAIGAAFLAKHDATSAPIATYNFPGTTCISVNEAVAHGIPGSRVLRHGDMVNIDVSAICGGYVGDTGGSFVLGRAAEGVEAKLLESTRRARDEALNQLRDGVSLRTVGQTVERIAKDAGFSVIRNLGSHGVGRSLHEAPEFIPSFYDPSEQRIVREGMVLTVEPFLTTGKTIARTARDGWTLLNRSGSLSAQFEHTLIITKGAPIITTIPG